MTTEIKAIAALVAAIVLFLAGFATAHEMASSKAAAIAVKQADADKAALASQLALQRQLDDARDDRAARVGTIDTTQTGMLNDEKQELANLRDCVARGTCGLRVLAAKCPASPKVPGSGDSAGVGTGANPELDPDARSTYFTLRSAIATKERQLEACQQILEAERR